MSVPHAVGWKPGETPTVRAGLQHSGDGDRPHASAHRLSAAQRRHPGGREPTAAGTKPFRPKDYIQGKVKARAGAAPKGGNRITLLRDADGDGKSRSCGRSCSTICTRPTASRWSARTLYVANTDAIMAFPFTPGETQITRPA